MIADAIAMASPALAGGAAAAGVAVAGAALQRSTPPRALPGRSDDPVGPPRGAERSARRLRIGVTVVVAVPVAVVAGPVLVVAVGTAAAGLAATSRRRRAGATQRAIDAAMPDAIELLVACLHAGRSPSQAVVELARLAPLPVRPGFAAVEQRLHRGQGLGDALSELTVRCGRSALPLVTAMSAAVRDGLPLAPVLDRLTDEANASRRRQGEAAARRLPVRLSFPLVVCTLPSFVLLSIAPAILGALSSLRDSPL